MRFFWDGNHFLEDVCLVYPYRKCNEQNVIVSYELKNMNQGVFVDVFGAISGIGGSVGSYGLLGQWLNFKLFGITYLAGKISRSNFFFQGPLAE